MKKIYILSSLVLAGALTSCYDLNTEPMGSSITEKQREEMIERDESKISGISDGIYKYYNEFGWFAGDYYDFGYPSIMLALDSRTADFISVRADTYGWFASCAKFTDNTASSGYTAVKWGLCYGIIYASNELIGMVTEEQAQDNFYRSMLGQAYGNRAFAYWILAQLFQFNYAQLDAAGNPYKDKMCVPIITEKNYAEVQENGAPRATVAQVYDQILNDLNTGIEMMTNNPYASRPDKRYIDVNVLLALRARTYLCMQEYDKAAADAQKVIDSGAFRPLTAQEAIGPGFNSISDPNWIWGIYYYMEDATGLYTLPGFMGSYTYGYAYAGMAKCITNTLYEQISTNDPRKLWWTNPNTGASNADTYTDAVVSPDAGVSSAAEYVQSFFPTYATTKYAPYMNVIGQSDNQGDIPLIRIEEMYYILAEALGKGEAGNAAGVTVLENFVNDYRWLNSKAPYKFADTGKTFMEEIFFQREVEFWGEGMTYYDILRLNLPILRSNTSWTDPNYRMSNYAVDVYSNDPVLIFQIPQNEIDNNPALSESDQNETGSVL